MICYHQFATLVICSHLILSSVSVCITVDDSFSPVSLPSDDIVLEFVGYF